jgi:hypothetical protein
MLSSDSYNFVPLNQDDLLAVDRYRFEEGLVSKSNSIVKEMIFSKFWC